MFLRRRGIFVVPRGEAGAMGTCCRGPSMGGEVELFQPAPPYLLQNAPKWLRRRYGRGRVTSPRPQHALRWLQLCSEGRDYTCHSFVGSTDNALSTRPLVDFVRPEAFIENLFSAAVLSCCLNSYGTLTSIIGARFPRFFWQHSCALKKIPYCYLYSTKCTHGFL